MARGVWFVGGELLDIVDLLLAHVGQHRKQRVRVALDLELHVVHRVAPFGCRDSVQLQLDASRWLIRQRVPLSVELVERQLKRSFRLFQPISGDLGPRAFANALDARLDARLFARPPQWHFLEHCARTATSVAAGT